MASTDPTAWVGLMPPPPGVTPDFHHTTSVQLRFIIVFAVTYALATIALLLRLYTRAFVVKSVGFDERMFAVCFDTDAISLSTDVVTALLVSAWAVTLAFFIVSVNG